MKKSITIQPLIAIFTALLIVCALSVLPMSAQAHEDEEDSDGHMHVDVAEVLDSGGSVEQLQSLVTILQQLVALLSQQVAMSSDSHTDMDMDMHMHEDATDDVFSVDVEVHSYRTHVHVQEPGEDLNTFFLDDVDYTDHDAVIAAVAEETGHSIDEVTDAITFPEGELDENGDSMEPEGHDHGDEDLSGIHIMPDGTVMLGNGEVVEDATIMDDGTIMLSDGDIVLPVMDMREGGSMSDMH